MKLWFRVSGCWIPVFVLLLIVVPTTFGDVRLPGFFSDHMVLQQQKPVKIWGWATPGEKVTVTLEGNSGTAVADAAGRWSVELPPVEGSHRAFELVVRGTNEVRLKDVLIGEVWLCSGQSNMEWTVARSKDSRLEIASAGFPLIRHIKIDRKPNTLPQEDIRATWSVCSPDTAGNFTACGYFMARRLFQELDVPIGLINSSWGGTRVEPWTPPVGFEKVSALKDIHRQVRNRTPGTVQFRERLAKHVEATQSWVNEAKASLTSGGPWTPSPPYPAEITPFKSHQDPTMLYNGMIHALVGYPIRGVIWYQGESNHVDGMMYFEKKKALINGWRELWGQGDFPFYYVQIAPFQYGSEDPTILARFWEAQAAVQRLSNTGMVVTNDIATVKDIHPPNKQDVGRRLANLALHHDYGRQEIVCRGPEFDSLMRKDERLVVKFTETGGGLKTRDGEVASHFEIIGPGSGGFRKANARLDGDRVILTSDEVKTPVAFRFAWHKLAEPNLTGGTGLPAGATRGGDLPEFVDTLPMSEYQLVYDLDLSKLGRSIAYDVDNSADVGEFDRIGYLVQLQPASGETRQVFVTMDAFTEDVRKIGIPTAASSAQFQARVSNLMVTSTESDLTTDAPIASGNIEFWPHNYGPSKEFRIPGASGSQYDMGDSFTVPVDGYGSMQIHNHGNRQTIFAINHWVAGKQADLGIGNSQGPHPDWTFSGNAHSYANARLRVFVRPE